VFTPFWRNWSATGWDPWPSPGSASILNDPGDGVPPRDAEPWMAAGEEGARLRLDGFNPLEYEATRD
jgi:hypothetical protein